MRAAARCFDFSRGRISVPRWVLAFLFCFCVQGAWPAQAANEVVLFHGKVFTGEPEHPYAEAVAIRDDKIVAVGNRGDVSRWWRAMPSSSTSRAIS